MGWREEDGGRNFQQRRDEMRLGIKSRSAYITTGAREGRRMGGWKGGRKGSNRFSVCYSVLL